MAVYKVIQNVEAEDKLLGPLTLKAFIYASIAGVSAFLEFRLAIAGSLGSVRFALMLVFLGPLVLFGVLASPLGREQPTEVWLLSRIRFFFKPRVRLWDQSGVKQLVTITVPKKIEHQLTKNLSQAEVHSRLQALASTLDSRGWATKNADIDVAAGPGDDGDSDRLVGASNLPQNGPVIDIHAEDDILDEQNNATAQNFASLMQQADDNRKKSIADKINAARTGAVTPQQAVDSTFLDQQTAGDQGSPTIFVGKQVVAPDSADNTPTGSTAPVTETEKQLLDRLHREAAELESKLPKHFRSDSALINKPAAAPTAAPVVTATPVPVKVEKPQPPQVTPEVQAAKLELAQSGNDLTVASIAHLANRKNQMQQIGPNEFEIDLH